MRRMPRPSPYGLAAAGLLLCLAAGLVRAESDRASPQQFFNAEHLRATEDAARGAAHDRWSSTVRRILMHRAASDPRFAADRRPSRPVVSAPPHAEAIVAVFGDRFGQALAAGLEDNTDNHVAVTPLTTDDAALSRVDFGDWLQSIRARLARPDHPGLAIVMLGSNDRQPLIENGVPVEATNPRWAALYGARVEALAATFRDAHVGLIWVGLPSVHSEEISADFVRLNGIVRDRIASYGATYVDSWEAFSDENGRYSPVGPDVEGQSVKLRKAEGFGFTRAGARKLASFVESDVKRLRAPAPPDPKIADITIETARDFDQALQIDVNAQIRREAGLPPEAGAADPMPPMGAPRPAADR